MNVICEETAKPVPRTSTDVPTGPLCGDRVIAEVTMKVAEPVLELASVTVTV